MHTVANSNYIGEQTNQTLAATHRAMWALGDYALMAEEVMAPLGPILVSATRIGPGVRVLDAAAGSGNISLPAARTGATVVSTDLTPELLRRSRARAAEQGLALEYQEANALALPFEAYANIGNNAVLAAELDAQLVELAEEYLVNGVMEWEYLLFTAVKR